MNIKTDIFDVKFCMRCGTRLVWKKSGEDVSRKYCPRCRKYYADEPAVCVLTAFINENGQVLLLKEEGKYVLCHAYPKIGETLEETVGRSIVGTGRYSERIEYFDSYYHTQKDIIMPCFIAYAMETPPTTELDPKDPDEMLWSEPETAADLILRVNELYGIFLDKVIEKLTGKRITKGTVRTEYFVAYLNDKCLYRVIFFDKVISDDYDRFEFEETVKRVLNTGIAPWGYYCQSLVKDNISIDLLWDDFYGYRWEAIAETEEDEKKIVEWAAAASEEFMKRKEKSEK